MTDRRDIDGIYTDDAIKKRMAHVRKRPAPTPTPSERIAGEVRLNPEFEARRAVLVASVLPLGYSANGNPLADELGAMLRVRANCNVQITGGVKIVIGARISTQDDEVYTSRRGCVLCRQPEASTVTVAIGDRRLTFVRDKRHVWRLSNVMTPPTSGRGAGYRGRANGTAMEPSAGK